MLLYRSDVGHSALLDTHGYPRATRQLRCLPQFPRAQVARSVNFEAALNIDAARDLILAGSHSTPWRVFQVRFYPDTVVHRNANRSEERRVGKECRSWRCVCYYKK